LGLNQQNDWPSQNFKYGKWVPIWCGCDTLDLNFSAQTVEGIRMLYAPLVATWRSSWLSYLPLTVVFDRLAAAQRSLTRLAVTVGVLGLAACASPPPPPPPPVVSEIQLSVIAGADVNPDARKRASPVTVRIYALKSAAPFEAADFFSLFEKDTATLGSELVQREEFLMRPGDQKALPMKFGPEVKAIGVMVAYRDLERARWREVHTIDIGKAVDLKVRLNGSQIALEKKLLPPPPPPAKK
jgi:type VI secretion system protein VasD